MVHPSRVPLGYRAEAGVAWVTAAKEAAALHSYLMPFLLLRASIKTRPSMNSLG